MSIKDVLLRAASMSLVGLFATNIANAQNAGTIHYEYQERIDRAINVSPLGLDLFGDTTNFENGNTQFKAIDAELATSVRVKGYAGRVFKVGTSRELMGSDLPIGDIFGWGWSPELPYIKGDFIKADGWIATTGNGSTGRCSSGNFAPGAKHVYTKVVLAHNFFFGNDINIPGQGSERLLALRPEGARPSDGSTYVGTTASHWKVSCLPTIKNGPGEGFVVTTPDGTKYHFDWMAIRDSGMIPYAYEDQYLAEYRLYASKAVDRFGGTLTYAYDSANPHRILSITASDGASMNFTYHAANGKVATVSTAGRTWQYGYTQTYASQRSFDVLNSVILPDGTAWALSGGPYLVSSKVGTQVCLFEPGTRTSNQLPGPYDASVITMTHPSGAVGTFKFRALMFGYNRTPDRCHAPVASATQPNTPYRPKAYISNALYEKQISGPGLTPIVWNMRYYPSWSYGYECGPSCPTTATTIVTDSEGETKSYIFGNDYLTNASQLLSLQITKAGKTRLEKYEYLTTATGQPFPDIRGDDRYQINNNPLLTRNRPRYRTTTTQDGRDFKTTVEQFDYLVRALRLRKENYPTPVAPPPVDPDPPLEPPCPGCQIP